ncbi:MAG: TonB-dependent receptor [Saprospiraceae bacterium]
MTRNRMFIWWAMMIMVVTQLNSQDHKLVVIADHQPPADFLMQLSLQSGVNIIYNENLLDKLSPVTLQMKNVTVEEVIQEVLRGSQINYRFVENQIVLYQMDSALTKYSISGVVTDSISGEPLIYAYIYDAVSGKSTTTNNYGYYSINVPSGQVNLLSGYAGYISQHKIFGLNQNQFVHFRLRQNGLLPEVVVHGNSKGKYDNLVPTADRISMSDLQSNVQLGGASDLYRVADFIPGVHTGTDGVGGIHVRGGANDQNLILMDGVPVYHPNHLLGIVSVFNYQVLQQASIYKANFPSKFSGRLSSVMDVRTREGNINEWGFSGNIGLSEVGAMVEGPIIKEKISLLLSGRFFLPGLFAKDLTRQYKKKNGKEGFADLDYMDFNGKLNWKISPRDRIYLSSYLGKDQFSDSTLTRRDERDPDTDIRIVSKEGSNKNLNWSNQTAVFRWNHIVNEKIFSNFILATSSFVLQSVDRSQYVYTFPDTNFISLSGFDTKEFKSSIKDVTARLELDIRPSTDHQLSTGIYAIRYTFLPKSITLNEESKVGEFYLKEGLLDDALFSSFKVNALESGIYLEDKWDIQPGIRLTSGIHISSFFVQGTYYLDPQLRLSFDYQPAPKIAFNLGYSRMAQYLHNLTSSSIGLPTDLWVPTTRRVSPALSDQYSFSTLWKPADNCTIDISAYMKNMRSLISYQEGASFQLEAGVLAASIVDAGNWESKITVGDGDASGIELQFNYDLKNLQFNLNGTWSKSYRRFDDINNGIAFPDRYDRRWSSTFSGQYKLNSKWSCGVNFLYGSGIAITLAESKFKNPGAIFPEIGINYSSRNGFRLPPYHRLDVTLNYQFSRDEKFSHSLTLNLYNVYNRVNPFYITLVKDPIKQTFQYRQFSLFRFFPSLTYRFSFQ